MHPANFETGRADGVEDLLYWIFHSSSSSLDSPREQQAVGARALSPAALEPRLLLLLLLLLLPTVY